MMYFFPLLLFHVCCTTFGSQNYDHSDNALASSDTSFTIKFPPERDFLNRGNDYSPIGHLKPLGNQRPPVGQIPQYFQHVSPRFLWENHVKVYRPALLRGLLNGSPALHLWTDEFLVKEYGNLQVLVEKKYEDRKTEPKRMSIEGFLKQYREQNWYVVSILPDEMKKDIKVPKPLMCSSFQKNLQELNLWIGTKGTRSMLHYDADNILHCLVAGRKDWILIHPDNKFRSAMGTNSPGQNSGFSVLNVDSINVYNSPDVSNIPWEYATLYPGDCIYLPPQYMHQVRSYNRSISTTFLFFPHSDFTDDDCAMLDLDSYKNLSDVYVFWGLKQGQETVDMGYRNPIEVKDFFLRVCDSFNLRLLDWQYFLYLHTFYSQESLEDESLLRKTYDDFDMNRDGLISYFEFEKVDIEVWKELCRYTESPHGPTLTEMRSDVKRTDATAEFNPRVNLHYADARFCRSMLETLLDKYGEGTALPFHKFKKIVDVVEGSIAEAFVLIDMDMDGILSIHEVKQVSKEKLKKFYSLGIVTSDEKLKRLMVFNEVEDGEDVVDSLLVKQVESSIKMMKEKGENELTFSEFHDIFKDVYLKNEQIQLDTKFIFKLLNRDDDVVRIDEMEAILSVKSEEEASLDDEFEGIRVAKQQSGQHEVNYGRMLLDMIDAVVVVQKHQKEKSNKDPTSKDEL